MEPESDKQWISNACNENWRINFAEECDELEEQI